jgi:HTH-type transcriptional regulator/antitoxin HigA
MDTNEGNAFVDDQRLRRMGARQEDPREAQADEWAHEALVPHAAWEASAIRKSPTPMAVMNLARALQVHPAIVAGKIREERQNYRLLSQFVGVGEVGRRLTGTM